MVASGSPIPPPMAQGLVERRVRSVLGAARARRTGVAVETLWELLPESEGFGESEAEEWIQSRPETATVVDGTAYAADSPPTPPEADRRARGKDFIDRAHSLLQNELAPVHPLLSSLGVTGSTAYGEPEEGDDVDFLAVVRPGAVWPFLAYCYLAVRLRPGRAGDPSAWCFNYVVDETAALEIFRRPQGFLFAREALSSRPIRGEPFYRGLLRASPWLREEAPRLYARWEVGGLPEPAAPSPAPAPVRLLNRLAFPLIAAYLHLAGLYRNHRLWREGRGAESFRVETRLDRLILRTEEYERLKALYAPASRIAGP
ncbi:MAG: hypothetical protein L3K09_04105 [Thermoplasmata archaeon]|nr:hypothetical protein [Thermoplasmata archaeon]